MILTPSAELNSVLTVVAVDPGINDLGLAVLTLDLKTQDLSIGPAYHIQPKHWQGYKQCVDVQDERMQKEVAIRTFFVWALDHFQPHVVVIESPFLHQMVNAFESLTIIMTLLRHDALDYDSGMPVIKVPPTVAKSALGVKDFKDKQAVKDAILQRTDVEMDRGLVRSLTEHATDAIAVGLTYLLTLKESLCSNSSPSPSLENSSVDLASLPSLPAFSSDGSIKTKSNRTTSSIRNSPKANSASTTSTRPLKPINSRIKLTSHSVVNSKTKSSNSKPNMTP